MRITNSMISNNSRVHIGNAKTELLKRQDQYTTQKKIQRPSDDPTIAMRSLQLRTTYSQLQQYSDKNVQDAMDWMDTTESALTTIDSILTDMKDKLNQGAHDTLDTQQRSFVLSQLKQYAEAIFSDNANQDISGRYLFTGYRTDTSLLFEEKTTSLEYEIRETFESTDIDAIKFVSEGARYSQATTSSATGAATYANLVPEEKQIYRIQLAYDQCSNTGITNGTITSGISVVLSDGTAITATPYASSSPDAYNATSGIHYIYDTGELIVSDTTYQQILENGSKLNVTYAKKSFEKGDIRPEMYFSCQSHNQISGKDITYADPSRQEIRYEVNFSQTCIVNTQAKDAVDTDIYRAVDYIEQTVNAVDELENKIAEVDKIISNTTNATELANLAKLKEVMEQEKSLRIGAMQQAFSKGLTMVDKVQDKVNVAIADLGARYKRMQLTESKLDDQLIDTEDKLSHTEGVSVEEAYINLTQADNLYQASLSATAKILGNSLLNYI